MAQQIRYRCHGFAVSSAIRISLARAVGHSPHPLIGGSGRPAVTGPPTSPSSHRRGRSPSSVAPSPRNWERPLTPRLGPAQFAAPPADRRPRHARTPRNSPDLLRAAGVASLGRHPDRTGQPPLSPPPPPRTGAGGYPRRASTTGGSLRSAAFASREPASPNFRLRNSSFRGYADYMHSPKFWEALDAVLLGGRGAEGGGHVLGKRVVAVSSKAGRRRSVLAVAFAVEHLMHDGRLAPPSTHRRRPTDRRRQCAIRRRGGDNCFDPTFRVRPLLRERVRQVAPAFLAPLGHGSRPDRPSPR